MVLLFGEDLSRLWAQCEAVAGGRTSHQAKSNLEWAKVVSKSQAINHKPMKWNRSPTLPTCRAGRW